MPKYPHNFLDGFRQKCHEKQLHVRTVAVFSPTYGYLSHDFKPQKATNLYSGAKTVTALGIGIAIDEGRLKLDMPLLGLFPWAKSFAAPGLEQITVRHLLKMSTGKHTRLFKTADRNTKTDYAEIFFKEPLDAEPGTTFYYNNASTYMLARAVEAVSGERLDRYLESRLMKPLGIKAARWHLCPHGHTLAFTELFLTGHDYAKIGQLLLQRGRFADHQLVDRAFVDAMHIDIIATDMFREPELSQGYGYQCWCGTRPGSYRADGLYGQYAVVSPKDNAVVTVTSHIVDDAYGIIEAIHAEIFDRLDQLED